jgi:hypothetical protein
MDTGAAFGGEANPESYSEASPQTRAGGSASL